MEEKTKPKTDYISAHGRRKEAVARIRLYKGKGEILVNNKPINVYFPAETQKLIWQRPFTVTKSEGEYWATIKVAGSGKSSQLDAIAHGLSRALVLQNAEYKAPLRRAGLLTRDSRVKERRKYGLAQKARKGKQSPKR
ncbi:MAG: 30S ribosomal protein S9 [Patescibacteria group bacterium]